MSVHRFLATLNWSAETVENSRYKKNHIVKIDGKVDLQISAAKAFKGESQLHNPEDLLLSSLMSCHMMSYMYCCEKHNVKILNYEDRGEALLEVNADGSGKIIAVSLNPIVYIDNEAQETLAKQLHQEAGKLCFIANSCNFEINYNPKIQVI